MTDASMDGGAGSLRVACQHRFEGGFELDVAFTTDHRITALFGPSGAGKTTLLMVVAGLVRADAARVVWRDRVLVDTEAGTWIPPHRRHLGVVFQDQRLFPHLSVEENLRYGQRRRRRTGPPLAAIARVLELEGHLDRAPSDLSGGERQRVALGRALMSGPELLLLDEPVAAVDEPRRETILEYVDRAIHEWDVPMLYVSHHRAEVHRLADRVVAVEAGRVVREGPPEEILDVGREPGLAGEPVNLLRLEDLRADGPGAWTGHLAGAPELTFRLPAGDGSPPPTAWVQFAPSDVMLARGEVRGLSARNRLRARVRQLVPRSGRIYVALEAGDQTLWAEVTRHAVEDLELSPDLPVVCLIKSAALELLH